MKSSYILQSSGDSAELIPVFAEGDEQNLRQIQVPQQLPVLALRNSVLFPGVVMPINISRDKSVRLARAAYNSDKKLAAVMQRDAKLDDPVFDDLHKVGTAANILRMLEMPDGSTTIILQGTRRIALGSMVSDDPFFVANVEALEDIIPPPNENYDLIIGSIRDVSMTIIKLSPHLAPEAGFTVRNIDSKQFLVNYLAVNTEVSGDEKQKLIEIDSVEQRASALLEILLRERQALELKSEIQQKVHKGIDRHNREFFLNEQMKAIQAELGGNPVEQEVKQLREKAKTKKWSEEVAAVFERETVKAEKMMQHSGEYPVQLNYLQTLVELPWGEYSEDKLDLDEAQKVLNEDHYGLEEVKERILEHLAVIKLKGDLKSPILCLYGPPGVGKTSLGKSVARALGREFGRISLGGLHDEAEIRGHRKTYVGAMPGRVIQTIKKCKLGNPVIILDEVDKVGNDFRGDPSSALLEVLDPEQNATFYDNFLELDYDLSHVLFITTANNVSTIHPALCDRMEMIEVSGYTQEEKVEIVKRHLLPRLLKDHGVQPAQLQISDALVTYIIENYTRESGVRGVEKQLAKIIRHTAKLIASSKDYSPQLTQGALQEALGAPKFIRDKALDNAFTGVATGLAWTPNGGEILFVEASLSKGKGLIATTGSLGDVMKESAIIALEYVRAQADFLQIDPKMFAENNLHIHVPEGAIPKDGPSAGVTMVTAIASVFTGRKVRCGLAMTGEATLRGKVLPIGGVKEKILAAKRAGITDILLPVENKKDIDEIKKEYLQGLTFTYVDAIKDVLKFALEGV
ncbi:MAG: endopeptidase La [Prevotellaceae bacterium]|jgi:ATP-dependent Lon protease|nr:endopeptidase La [Prevotellaceae bacterium]